MRLDYSFGHFEYPFAYFDGYQYGVKPAWAVFAVFLLILTLVRAASPRGRPETFKFSSLYKAILFAALSLLCYFLPYVVTDDSGVEKFAEVILQWEIPVSVLLLFSLLWTLAYKKKYGNRTQYLGVVEKMGKILIYIFVACTITLHILDGPLIANILWVACLWFLLPFLDVALLLLYKAVSFLSGIFPPLFYPLFFLANAIRRTLDRTRRQENENTPSNDDRTRRQGNHNAARLTSAPLERYQDLSKKKQERADALKTLLQNGDSESRSICVSGKWGSGKTSVVNGALDKLRSEDWNYEEIRINALDLDTSQDLLDYVYARIRTILQEHDVYVGIGSEYQEFLFSTAGDLSNQNMVSLIEQTLFPSASEYRERREAMEELLQNAMRGRIVIVVDDIERCEEKKTKDFVFFSREAAALSHCTVIFITDYDYLMGKLAKPSGTQESQESQDPLYFEKFFDIRFDIPDTDDASDLLAICERELRQTLQRVPAPSLNEVWEQLPGQWFSEQTFNLLRDRAETEHGEAHGDERERLEKEKKRFFADTSNMRNMVKMCLRILDYYKTVDHAAGTRFSENGAERLRVSETELPGFWERIKADKILFFLAYLEICYPDEYRSLRNNASAYLDELPKDAFNFGGQVKSLIGKLGDGLFFDIHDDSGLTNRAETSTSSRNSLVDETYIRGNRRQFLEVLFSEKPDEELWKVVNPYAGEGERLLHDLDENAENVKRRLPETVLAACADSRNQNWRTNQERRNRLVHDAEELIHDGEWNAKGLLSCFLPQNGVIGSRLHFMRSLYDIFRAHETETGWANCLSPEDIHHVWGRYSELLPADLDRLYTPLCFYARIDCVINLRNLTNILAGNGKEHLERSLNKLRQMCGQSDNPFPRLDDRLLVPDSPDGGEMPEFQILRRLRDTVRHDIENYRNAFGGDGPGCRDLFSADAMEEMSDATEDVISYIKLCEVLQGILSARRTSPPYEPAMDVSDPNVIRQAIDGFHRASTASLPEKATLRNNYHYMMKAIADGNIRFDLERNRELFQSLWNLADEMEFNEGEEMRIGRILYDACQASPRGEEASANVRD